ncbi:unnamed protein product [Clavelina lepadiformis]|uniref:PIF1/LRR1 pleckstrin homology domain-containing protein n=1 Tax=Clavelina lepadiformis TaxID=159417 RepID=A0ABP0FJ29_CLALP
MRIKCQIEILNRCAASQGLRGGCGKSAQATLFLAKKPGDIVFLIFCTAKDKQGTKYRVNKNIQQIFGKFVSDGKATIRLKEPVVDMCISKADPVELKRILNAIKSAHLGKTLLGQSILSSMAPAKTKHVEKPKTKLVVTSRKDYPVTSSFPLMLERLHIHDCNLARLDSRLFNLKHLYLLDVSSNKIKTLPTALSQMESLCELNVAKNEISEIPAELCQPQAPWCKTLKSLNLGNNKLTCLPRNFHNFFNLWQLQLCNNSITKLPEQLGKLHNLRRLAASNNSIKYLPLSFTKLHLETLDLFMNPFVNDTQLPSNDVVCCSLKIPSLRELSGRIIRTGKTKTNRRSLPEFQVFDRDRSGEIGRKKARRLRAVSSLRWAGNMSPAKKRFRFILISVMYTHSLDV